MSPRSLRLLYLLGWVALLALLGGCPAQPPVSVDAPQLASALKFVGGAAVICSALGGAALVLASRNRRK